MAGKKGQKKRFWSDEEKRSICTQARAPGVSVAQVARRYSMNTNLIHKWLRDPRFTPAATDDGCAETEAAFLPVEIEAEALSPLAPPAPDVRVSAQRVDITLSDGRRMPPSLTPSSKQPR
ncbi:IS66-like element accessory protein TnpA [Aliiroseovarius sp. 2305UL8-7]|uniref:IS66-like element accessory protein TnpA n=1 Tax=Aliiroseovarius conchicola TaxID=3121637 RepID=UPI0035289EF7